MQRNKYLISLLSFLVFFILEVISYTPNPRSAQISALVGSKLYYAGGFTGNSVNSNEIFYLDLSNSFQTSSPPWVSLAEVSIPVSPDYSTSILSPFDNSTIYLIGGYMVNPITFEPSLNTTVYTFDTNSLKWNAPQTNGSIPTGRQEMDAVVDSKGKIYIFGGNVITNFTSFAADYYNDINILDLSTNSWTNIQPTSSSPNERADYTATLLSSGYIVYIGGQESSSNGTLSVVDLKNLRIFDTNSLNWSSMTATGVDLQARQFHTAVLSKNGQIIIYGGEDESSRSVTPNLAVLNTTVEPYNWYIPTVLTNTNSPPPLAEHSATMYGDYMIIAFGYITDTNGTTTNFNKQLYILDTTSYSWVSSFTALPSPSLNPSSGPSVTSTESSTPTPSSHFNKPALIIGLSVSFGFLGLISVGALTFYLIKRRKNNSGKEILRIPGESTQ